MSKSMGLVGRGFAYLAASVILLLLAACGPADSSKVPSTSASYYVSPLGNDDWSGQLEVPNKSGTDGPFLTLQRAKEEVRLRLRKPQTEDFIVYIREGTYFLEAPLVFHKEDSGRDGFHVIFRNYAGEAPVISGGIELTDWEPLEDGVFTTSVDAAFNVLYEGDQTGVLARYPNRNPEAISPGKHAYMKIGALLEGHEYEGFYFDPQTFPALDDWSTLEMTTWNGGEHGEFHWRTYMGQVTQISYADGTLMADLNDISPRWVDMLGPGTDYFIQNSPELLDAPGEFYLDQNTLYYRPWQAPGEGHPVIAPRLDYLIKFEGTENDPVSNIVIQGLTLRHTDGREAAAAEDDAFGIYVKNAEDIQILGNHLQHIGGIGIYTTGNGVRRITIENNLIDHIGDTAIEINGQWDVPNESNEHLIENNHIHHTGMLIPSARGIQIYNSSNDRVAHNLLHDIPKGAIGFGGSGTSNTLVEFNEIHSVLQDSQDMGPIYFGGVGPDNVIHNNYLHDVYGLFSYQGGIYMDQGTSGYTITDNLVENFGWQGGGRISGLIDASDVETVIRNNFLVLNNVHLSSAIFPREYSIEEAGTEANSAASTPPNDIDVIGNIFYNNDGPIYSFRFGSEGSWLRQSDMNLFFSDQGMYRVVGIPGVITLEDWQALADGRFDQNSLIADPLFVNVESSDYRLRFDSPAYGLGIEDIDQADVGLTADFPFESPDSSLHRMYITSDVAGNSANLHLAVGDEASLTITARTASGYVLDPGDYVQKCLSSEIDKVFVNHAGQIQAKEQGFAQVTCSVEADGVKLSLPVYVLVDTTVEEAAALVPPAALPDTQPAYLEELERIDFDTNEGLFDHWPSYNSWEIVHEDGAVMYCGYEEVTGTHMSFGSMGWTDYQVDVRLRITGEPNAAAEIRQREGWGDNTHQYGHTLNSGAEGQWVSQIYCDSEDCSAWKSINTPIGRGEWIQFRAEVEGTRVRTYLNGRLVLTQYLDLTSVGNAGIRARPGTTLCIDDIVVRSLDRSAEALDRAGTAQSSRSQPVYLWPGEDQKVIGQLPGGVEVYLLDEDQEWAYIRLDSSGLQGWVPIQGLEMP